MSLESHKNGKVVLVDETFYQCKDVKENQVPFGYVYCIENRFTGKRYIGSTNDFDRRVSEYIRSSQKSSEDLSRPIDKAIAQEGVWSFRMYKVQACYSAEELAAAEYAHIRFWNTLEPNGYNNTTTTTVARGSKVGIYPTGILPNADNRRKRSRPIVAVNPDSLIAYYSDSLKLFAELILETDRAVASHAAKLNQKTKGYYLFYLDRVSNDNAIKEMLAKYERNAGKRSGCRTGRDIEYTELSNAIILDGPKYFINNLYTVYSIRYIDSGTRSEVSLEFDPVEYLKNIKDEA